MADTELSPCVKLLLCGLSSTVLGSIRGLLNTLLGLLTPYKLQLEAQLIYLDIATVPVKLANDLVQNALSQATSVANIIPFALVAQCTDLGDLNETISKNIRTLAADANSLAADLTRLLSLKDEVELLVEQVNTTINLYNALLQQIDACAVLGLT